MKANQLLSTCVIFLFSLINLANGQEFFNGAKSSTATISRSGVTTFGYSQIRNNSTIFATVLEHIHPEGDLYVRSVRSKGSGETGNVIINDNGGLVGIGTTTPQAKLAVNGNILAKEIKIKTDISVPDYVFEDTYNLPSLSSIENYVKEHKHLPEVPSAKDIEENGLDVAGMNLLLLKKIEELTLHLIEKEKEIETIKNTLQKIQGQ